MTPSKLKIILDLDVVIAGSCKFFSGISRVKKLLRFLAKKDDIELYIPEVQLSVFSRFLKQYFRNVIPEIYKEVKIEDFTLKINEIEHKRIKKFIDNSYEYFNIKKVKTDNFYQFLIQARHLINDRILAHYIALALSLNNAYILTGDKLKYYNYSNTIGISELREILESRYGEKNVPKTFYIKSIKDTEIMPKMLYIENVKKAKITKLKSGVEVKFKLGKNSDNFKIITACKRGYMGKIRNLGSGKIIVSCERKRGGFSEE
ncbi:MAG: hypothetical protein ACTSRP_05305 [Candidatus Helarchaeota archaeon]